MASRRAPAPALRRGCHRLGPHWPLWAAPAGCTPILRQVAPPPVGRSGDSGYSGHGSPVSTGAAVSSTAASAPRVASGCIASCRRSLSRVLIGFLADFARGAPSRDVRWSLPLLGGDLLGSRGWAHGALCPGLPRACPPGVAGQALGCPEVGSWAAPGRASCAARPGPLPAPGRHMARRGPVALRLRSARCRAPARSRTPVCWRGRAAGPRCGPRARSGRPAARAPRRILAAVQAAGFLRPRYPRRGAAAIAWYAPPGAARCRSRGSGSRSIVPADAPAPAPDQPLGRLLPSQAPVPAGLAPAATAWSGRARRPAPLPLHRLPRARPARACRRRGRSRGDLATVSLPLAAARSAEARRVLPGPAPAPTLRCKAAEPRTRVAHSTALRAPPGSWRAAAAASPSLGRCAPSSPPTPPRRCAPRGVRLRLCRAPPAPSSAPRARAVLAPRSPRAVHDPPRWGGSWARPAGVPARTHALAPRSRSLAAVLRHGGRRGPAATPFRVFGPGWRQVRPATAAAIGRGPPVGVLSPRPAGGPRVG